VDRPSPLSALPRDGRILFVTRAVRLLAYGAMSVILVLYLTGLGVSPSRTGLLLTLTLAGDVAISLWLVTRADRVGRRRILVVGAALMTAAGLVFAGTRTFGVLLIAGIVGIISPSGQEVGPFLPIEQAALSQLVPGRVRTAVFGWYTLVGAFASAAGALIGGGLSQTLQRMALTPVASYRVIVVGYAALGLVLAACFARVSPAAEPARTEAGHGPRYAWGVGPSRRVVLRLSALFALDSFAGGFVVQSFAAYWFHVRFGAAPGELGAIFFGANLLAGASALLAARLATRIGLVRTMVFTHLPSNLLLILVPLMPDLRLAVLVLFARFSISQMDVPTRQSYVMAVVAPEERSAAAGITGVARTTGAAIAPLFAGWMFARPALASLPFFLAGGLKIVYDLALYRGFRTVHPRETEPQRDAV